MTIVALERVALVNALGDMGDRQQQGLSTVIRGREWHIEANYQQGTIGDATIYHNANANTKDADPNWKWYAAIPTANIKAYRLAGDVPQPSAVADGQPQTTNTTSRAQGSGAAAKS